MEINVTVRSFPRSPMEGGKTMAGNKVHIILLVTLLLLAIFPVSAFAASWAEIIYDSEVPAQTRKNIASAVDTVADLLTQYNIALRYDIKVVVTADTESYIQALMFYNKDSRAKAEEVAKSSGGVSLNDRHILLIRGTSLLNTSPSEVYRVVPHELFHQVQNQYGKARTLNWLVEGTPEVFQFVAREKAGFGKVADFVRQAEQIVRQDSAIPDVRELANYQSFQFIPDKPKQE